MKYLEILDKVRSVFTKSTGVEMSFGKPMELNDLSIIPVARVSFGVGFGGGSSPSTKKKDKKSEQPEEPEITSEEKPEASEGGGGGGGMNTVPVGIYAIKGSKVSFYPVVGFRDILAAMGLISLLLIRLSKKKNKRVK